ncbi:pseudouridine synthase [Ghiorsea bivora]|uniref:pseudouridine synthase n=1 Tax=Ghiorsea bivora TaxID=1485545 RepID=UPI000690F923|nr:pseudouridine synthase [Ghiorsea bivora]
MNDKRKQPEKPENTGVRINKYLASCGLCSRREADKMIEAGRVQVNGEVVTQMGTKIQPNDLVLVDDKPVDNNQEQIYLLYNKPRGLLCSRKDDKGRPLIYDHLDIPAHVQSVGRLDMDSEGLLLLTSNGEILQTLIAPKNKIPRKYKVKFTGSLSLESIEKLRNGGIDLGKGELSDPWDMSIDSDNGGHSWITVTIKRGRWREIRRTLDAVGHIVRRLIRVRFGPIKLEEGMPIGSWRNLSSKEVAALKRLHKDASK